MADTSEAERVAKAQVSAASCRFVDSHVHLDTLCDRLRVPSYGDLFVRCKGFDARYDGCVSIFSDPASLSPSFGTWPSHVQNEGVYAAFGCHPLHAAHYDQRMENRIKECLQHEKGIAWGECGLDYSHLKHATKEEQKRCLVAQLLCAVELGYPIIIHSRRASKDTQDLLVAHLPKSWKIHIHCFSDNLQVAKFYLQHFPNCFLGFTGMLTFKSSSRLEEVVREIPLDRILLETDAPYLTPQPLSRKKPSHPGMCTFVAERIALLRKIPVEEVYQQVRKNTTKMYGI